MDATIISALRKTAEGLSALAEAMESGAFGVPDPPNLTVKDVAKLLNCAEETVRSAVHREGDPVPCINVGTLLRFRRSEVLEWASRQRPMRSQPVVQRTETAPRTVVSGVRKAVRKLR